MATGRFRYKYHEDRSPEENIALALYAVANELSDLGVANADTPMGAIELLASEVKGLSESFDYFAEIYANTAASQAGGPRDD